MDLVDSNRSITDSGEEIENGEIVISQNEVPKEEFSDESVENFPEEASGTLVTAPEERRNESTSTHVNKLAELLANIDSVVKRHATQIERLEEQNQQLSLLYRRLDGSYRSVQQENRQLREQLRRQDRRVLGRVSGVEQGQRRLSELNRRTICELETHVRRKKILPGETSIANLENGIAWKFEGVQGLLEGRKDVWGPCFYLRDYKFQVNISAVIVKGFLSFYVALVKGLHDDELEWPFQGEFVFILSNREKEKEVFRKEFVNTSRQANENFIKPKEMKNTPIGYPKFITTEQLKQDKYTRDDSIELTVLVNQIGNHSIN